jgi:hypothetical protein
VTLGDDESLVLQSMLVGELNTCATGEHSTLSTAGIHFMYTHVRMVVIVHIRLNLKLVSV